MSKKNRHNEHIKARREIAGTESLCNFIDITEQGNNWYRKVSNGYLVVTSGSCNLWQKFLFNNEIKKEIKSIKQLINN